MSLAIDVAEIFDEAQTLGRRYRDHNDDGLRTDSALALSKQRAFLNRAAWDELRHARRPPRPIEPAMCFSTTWPCCGVRMETRLGVPFWIHTGANTKCPRRRLVPA
jgi:hypothetical protein